MATGDMDLIISTRLSLFIQDGVHPGGLIIFTEDLDMVDTDTAVTDMVAVTVTVVDMDTVVVTVTVVDMDTVVVTDMVVDTDIIIGVITRDETQHTTKVPDVMQVIQLQLAEWVVQAILHKA